MAVQRTVQRTPASAVSLPWILVGSIILVVFVSVTAAVAAAATGEVIFPPECAPRLRRRLQIMWSQRRLF
jgi:hypothetical protein